MSRIQMLCWFSSFANVDRFQLLPVLTIPRRSMLQSGMCHQHASGLLPVVLSDILGLQTPVSVNLTDILQRAT